jgi:hypothetical protein
MLFKKLKEFKEQNKSPEKDEMKKSMKKPVLM